MSENLLVNKKEHFQKVIKKLGRENKKQNGNNPLIKLSADAEALLLAKHRANDNFRKSSLERAGRNRKKYKK